MTCFTSCDILIPGPRYLEKWPVIACDQYTSEPDYWARMRACVGDAPSALHCILPEAELQDCTETGYEEIHDAMRSYLRDGIFRKCQDAFVYTERTLADGTVRPGVIGAVDLEAYDYHRQAVTPVRATEETVEERIPPRMRIRRGAPLELPHVILLCDDGEDRLIGFLRGERASMELLYDLDLPGDGGHIRGWLADGVRAELFRQRLEAYGEEKRQAGDGSAPLLFAVGDGNHSLATARGCYDELKAQPGTDPAVLARARYALVELENIRDGARKMEPIHRLITETDPDSVLRFLEDTCADPDGCEIGWQAGERSGVIRLRTEGEAFPTASLQKALDNYLRGHQGEIDYIHGEETLRALACRKKAIGFILPPFTPEDLFRSIARGGVLPRKTFSIGAANDKRYYLEAREL